MEERKLTDKEERIAQSLPDKEFKKRYGKDWKSIKIATATKMAKMKESTIRKFIRAEIKSLAEKNNEPSDAEYDQMAKDAEQDDLLRKAAELGYIDLEEIGMFHDPIGYKKSEPNPKDQIFKKKYKGNGIYDIFKNGKKVKTIKGEGEANAWINNAKKELDEAGPFKGGNYLPGAEDIDFDVKSINMVYTDFGRFYGFNMYSEPGFKGQREKFSFRADVNDFLKLKGIETEIPEGYDMDVLDSIVADLKKQGIEAEHHDYMDVSEGYTSEWDPETAAANQEFIRKREKEDRLNTAWAAFKKAEMDGDIRGQELALAMMDLIQNEPIKKVRSPESEKFRKKVKDYLAKKKAKNLKESQELKLGVKYDLEGKSGYIMTGGSKDPKDWTFSISGSDQKLNYLTVKNKLTPSEKQPGKYDGAFDLGQGKGHHIDESKLLDRIKEKPTVEERTAVLKYWLAKSPSRSQLPDMYSLTKENYEGNDPLILSYIEKMDQDIPFRILRQEDIFFKGELIRMLNLPDDQEYIQDWENTLETNRTDPFGNKLTPQNHDFIADFVKANPDLAESKTLKEMASELGYMNEESTETGLMVIPRTRQDANKIYAYLDDSNWTADWNSAEGYFLFPEEEDMYDSLEAEIEEFLVDIGANARIEGVFNESKQININEAVYTDPNTGKSYDLQFVSSKNRWELDIMKKGASIYSSAITTIKRKTVEEIIDWLERYNIDSSWVKKSL